MATIIDAASAVVSLLALAVITIGIVAAVFVLLIGALLFFSGVGQRTGKSMLFGSVALLIVFTTIYMWLFGAAGPPDITRLFSLP